MNTTQVVANWLVGREIVEEQQKGVHKAGYGDALLASLATQLVADFGPGYSGTNLRWFRQFYFVYGDLLSEQICHAVRDKLMPAIVHAARGESESAWKQPVDRYCEQIVDAVRQLSGASIGYAVRSQSWIPNGLGAAHPWN